MFARCATWMPCARTPPFLGMGAGTEATASYLTNHVRQVFTDLYLSSGAWYESAPPLMLVAPEECAPYAFEP